ncbi:MAG: hypothetical protein D6760_13550 [Deltaproteobacteria bacterium]|nr:MAG: hypothetical protein D6760_13550 [Deltaproteobacteria bacterium]
MRETLNLPSGRKITVRPAGLLTLTEVQRRIGDGGDTSAAIDALIYGVCRCALDPKLTIETPANGELHFEELEIDDQVALLAWILEQLRADALEEKLRPLLTTATSS